MYGTWDAYPVEAGADVFLPVLADWGIEVGPELVFDISCYRVTLVSNDENPVYEYLNYPLWISSLPQYTTTHQISKNVTDLQFFWSSPLNLTKSGDPLVYTTPNSWLEAPDFSKEQPFVANPFMVAQSAAQAGKEAGQYLLSALVSVDGGGKVMAVSSQYFVSTLMLDYTGAYTNLEYVVKGLLYLTGEEGLLELRNRTNSLSLHKVSQTELEAAFPKVMLFTAVIVPLIPLIIGVGFFLWRKYKKGTDL